MSNGGSYDPHAVEGEIYRLWETQRCFRAEPSADKRPYVIDIPLPNVTGALHLGHALNNTLQDVLIRHHRMCGYEALWMPGTDHAGIATQAVVETRLREQENLTRHELGRDGLVERIWQWKEEYGGRILNQLRRLGASCDWDRARFTLDEVCAKAVYEVFFHWFKAGLIYRGLRLVNWDAYLQTAVADDEIVHETVRGHLWHYRYPILTEGGAGGSPADAAVAADLPVGRLPDDEASTAVANATREGAELGVDYLAIATTRPETMLGDTAIAVHPDDPRYKRLIGRYCLLPLVNRPIPIIADGLLVKQEFGTGCVKVTPGHDPNDYTCGQRNNLEMINILTPDGRIREDDLLAPYGGLERYDARKKVVADLDALGLMERIEDYEHEVGHSDRSKTPIEPMLSEQWFVNMADLAESAMEAARDGRVQFYPARYEKTYLDWLGEKRDWCISRQLWWGHRIPVWRWPSEFRYAAPGASGKLHGAIAKGLVATSFQRDTRDYTGLMTALSGGTQPSPESIPGIAKLCFCPCPEFINEFTEIADGMGLEQDPDVLDTWFSSALWPFSTLGWPDNYGKGSGEDSNAAPLTTDLSYFYPTTVLVTSRDIITLWVARMVMTGLYFQGRVPFSHVHIHPVIQDGQGKRMSKSTGNGVDPLDIIELYGTDALRFTMAQMDTETQDARLPVDYICPHCEAEFGQKPQHLKKPTVKCEKCKQDFATRVADEEKINKLGLGLTTSPKFEIGRNFCNKIWQATTGFVLPNLEAAEPRPLSADDLAIEDRWILSRLTAATDEINRRFERYHINEVANTLYGFFWNDFCDWYVELVKPRLFERDAAGQMAARTDESAQVARQVLAHVLDQALRLLHPVLPFITEALWKQLAEKAPRRGLTEIREAEPLLIKAAWPQVGERDHQVEREIEALQNVIRAQRDTLARINTARAATKSGAIGKLPHAVIKADKSIAAGLADQIAVLERLGRCEKVEVGADIAKPPESATQVLTGVEVYVPLGGLMDLEAERKRLNKERDDLRGHIARLTGKLSNEGFVSKAPAAVVDKERERLVDMKDRLANIERNLADLGG